LWARVDPGADLVLRTFVVFGTGHDIDPDKFAGSLAHVGTVQLHGGALVIHIFEEFT
jgi:hypothetical protein